MNHGIKATIKMSFNSVYNGSVIILRNVTEIHYNYLSYSFNNDKMIAFESDLHQTGYTYHVNDIVEFETELESELAENM